MSGDWERRAGDAGDVITAQLSGLDTLAGADLSAVVIDASGAAVTTLTATAIGDPTDLVVQAQLGTWQTGLTITNETLYGVVWKVGTWTFPAVGAMTLTMGSIVPTPS